LEFAVQIDFDFLATIEELAKVPGKVKCDYQKEVRPNEGYQDPCGFVTAG
jgi:hypothetical protein